MKKSVLIMTLALFGVVAQAEQGARYDLKSYACTLVEGAATGLEIEYQGGDLVTTSYYGIRSYHHNGASFDAGSFETRIGFSAQQNEDPTKSPWTVKINGPLKIGIQQVEGSYWESSFNQGKARCLVDVAKIF